MSPQKLHTLCLSLPAAEASQPFGPGTTVYKVCNKMFALSNLEGDPLQVNLKCEPHLAEALRQDFEAVQPGYHMNKRHWNTVTVGLDLPDVQIIAQIEESYALVVKGLKKAERDTLKKNSA